MFFLDRWTGRSYVPSGVTGIEDLHFPSEGHEACGQHLVQPGVRHGHELRKQHSCARCQLVRRPEGDAVGQTCSGPNDICQPNRPPPPLNVHLT